MYHPENLQITDIDRVHVSVAGLFDGYAWPLERKAPIDDAPTKTGARAYHDQTIWAEVGQLLAQC